MSWNTTSKLECRYMDFLSSLSKKKWKGSGAVVDGPAGISGDKFNFY